METKHIPFKELRKAYREVKLFLESQTYSNISSLNFKIQADGAIAGDDILEMIHLFSIKYELDFKEFSFEKHFNTEAEVIVNPIKTCVWIIITKFTVLLGYLFNKKFDSTTSPKFYRETKDLTFGDLLTSYIEKKFVYRNEISYLIN